MRPFGTIDGAPVHEARIEAGGGVMSASIIEYGAVLRDLHVRRRDGRRQRVVLGFDRLEDYIAHSPHCGAIAGRFANRIGGGTFWLDGQRYQLPLNQDGRHSLHGGHGFGVRPWRFVQATADSVTLALVSPDGDQGYPGTMHVTCRYTLAAPMTLRIALEATTDRATVVNLCHHSYFNLDGGTDVLDHELEVRANLFVSVDADLIPDGQILAVAGTPLDFRKPRPIRRLDAAGDRQRYDNAYLLRRDRLETGAVDDLDLAHASTLASAGSGLRMEVWTTEPALQVYDGAKLAVPVAGLDGARYGACAGLCLEPQHVPDSPNLPHFPSTVLRPRSVYRQLTEYRFA
ncbi:MAG TPA: aldose epimerase family protein [Vineibacter sp.]|nr:aldose epimerase family protein [Vineibacter sp.]